MHIGVSGPIYVREFEDFLSQSDYRRGRKLGLGGSQVNQICVELLDRGYELTIFTVAKDVDEEVILDGPNLRICIGPYRRSGRARGLDFFRVERKYLERAVRRESPDFVHAHWTYEFALGPMATSVPVLTTIRDWAPRILREDLSIYRFLRLLMAVWVFVKGRHFTSNSEYIRQYAERWTLHQAPVVPNGLHDRYFLDRDAERLPDLDAPTLISINNGFSPLKNVRTLLRAFQHVRNRHPQATLRLLGARYGDGEEAHRWSQKHGLSDGVDFVGHVGHEEVVTALRETELLVHPSLEESFGNTLVEAMAQRTPVVGGKESGAVPWVLDEGQAGLLTDVSSPKALAESITRILDSEDLWSSYSGAGYQRAHTYFRLSQVVDQYIDQYKQLLSDNESPSHP